MLSRMLGKKYPLTVGIQITNRCNLRCGYCDYTSNSAEGELSYEEWIKVIDDMHRAGTMAITISGGEPFLRKDLMKLIAYAKNKKMCVLLCSNGFGVEENIKELKMVDNIGISLDGDRAAHDTIRGEGSHKAAVAAILACKDNNIKVTHGAVLTKINMGEIDYLLSFAKRYGTSVGFQILHYNAADETAASKNWKASKKIGDMCPSPEEIKKTFSYLIEKKRLGYPIANSMVYLKAVTEWPCYPNLHHENIHNKIGCFAGRYYCFIYPDGSLFPCNMFHENKLNVKDGGFMQAFLKAEKKRDCNSCLLPCHLERNILSSHKLESALTWYGTALKNTE